MKTKIGKLFIYMAVLALTFAVHASANATTLTINQSLGGSKLQIDGPQGAEVFQDTIWGPGSRTWDLSDGVYYFQVQMCNGTWKDYGFVNLSSGTVTLDTTKSDTYIYHQVDSNTIRVGLPDPTTSVKIERTEGDAHQVQLEGPILPWLTSCDPGYFNNTFFTATKTFCNLTDGKWLVWVHFYSMGWRLGYINVSNGTVTIDDSSNQEFKDNVSAYAISDITLTVDRTSGLGVKTQVDGPAGSGFQDTIWGAGSRTWSCLTDGTYILWTRLNDQITDLIGYVALGTDGTVTLLGGSDPIYTVVGNTVVVAAPTTTLTIDHSLGEKVQIDSSEGTGFQDVIWGAGSKTWNLPDGNYQFQARMCNGTWTNYAFVNLSSGTVILLPESDPDIYHQVDSNTIRVSLPDPTTIFTIVRSGGDAMAIDGPILTWLNWCDAGYHQERWYDATKTFSNLTDGRWLVWLHLPTGWTLGYINVANGTVDVDEANSSPLLVQLTSTSVLFGDLDAYLLTLCKEGREQVAGACSIGTLSDVRSTGTQGRGKGEKMSCVSAKATDYVEGLGLVDTLAEEMHSCIVSYFASGGKSTHFGE